MLKIRRTTQIINTEALRVAEEYKNMEIIGHSIKHRKNIIQRMIENKPEEEDRGNSR